MFRCLEEAPTIAPRVQGAPPSPAHGPGLGERMLPSCADVHLGWTRAPCEQPIRSQHILRGDLLLETLHGPEGEVPPLAGLLGTSGTNTVPAWRVSSSVRCSLQPETSSEAGRPGSSEPGAATFSAQLPYGLSESTLEAGRRCGTRTQTNKGSEK